MKKKLLEKEYHFQGAAMCVYIQKCVSFWLTVQPHCIVGSGEILDSMGKLWLHVSFLDLSHKALQECMHVVSSTYIITRTLRCSK